MVPEFLVAIGVAFGVVFVAELGDKTQLLALTFGSQYSLRRVALGLFLGYGSAGLVAVAVGQLLGANFPRRPIEIVGGVVFVVFGLLAWRSDGDDEVGHTIMRSSVVATIALTILVAEMGDKTQIATAALAARSNPVGTWIGATAGEVASGMMGAIAGTLVGDRIPEPALRLVSSLLFVGFGIAMLVGWP